MRRKISRNRSSQLKLDVRLRVGRLMTVLMLSLGVICLRLWYLGIIQHEKKLEEARRPQRRSTFEQPSRARIFDREGHALAVNRVSYRATLLYSEIRAVPRFEWREDEGGKKIRFPKRKAYIKELSEQIGNLLAKSPERIEELIHGKAALLGSFALVLEENIPEETFYRLKMLEKDFPGLHGELVLKRCYPSGRVACDVLGFLGPISKLEFDQTAAELKGLREFLAKVEEGEEMALPPGFHSINALAHRAMELEKRAYKLSDIVGKSGIEKSFEKSLRGGFGKKSYLADPKGNLICKLDEEQKKESGTPIELAISLELQSYAERLLIEAENEVGYSAAAFPPLAPWIRGSAVVAMEPETGQVVALASFPRYSPSDFCSGAVRVGQWLESDSYIASLWDGKEALKKESFDINGELVEIAQEIDLEGYFALTLPLESAVYKKISHFCTVADALFALRKSSRLLELFQSGEPLPRPISARRIFDYLYGIKNEALGRKEEAFLKEKQERHAEEIEEIKASLSPYFSGFTLTNEKLLLLDLYRMVIDERAFPSELASKIEKMTLSDFRKNERAALTLLDWLCPVASSAFHENGFKEWKEREGEAYLKALRLEEKKKRKNPRAAFDIFADLEKKQFKELWESQKWEILLSLARADRGRQSGFRSYLEKEKERALQTGRLRRHFELLEAALSAIEPPEAIKLIQLFRTFQMRTRALLGHYGAVKKRGEDYLERDLAAASIPRMALAMGAPLPIRKGCLWARFSRWYELCGSDESGPQRDVGAQPACDGR